MATINGNNSANTLYGTAYADSIFGFDGNDVLYGRAGNDTLDSGNHDDRLFGEDGNDLLKAGAGNDTVYGGANDDVLYGGLGNDSLFGDQGTDTLKGEAGNDTLKGGTGKLFAEGGDGADTIFYNPATPGQNISAIGSYFSTSSLSGGAGTDTVNIYNDSVYTSGSGTKAAQTKLSIDYYGKGYIEYFNPNDHWGSLISVGTIKADVESFKAFGNGGLMYVGDGYGSHGINITGTDAADKFFSYKGMDVMTGGRGNDEFHLGGGNDRVISQTDDADRLYFDFDPDYGYNGVTTVTGFNGQGFQGGDTLYFSSFMEDQIHATESNGHTIFDTDGATVALDVLGTGLVQNVDYFFV